MAKPNKINLRAFQQELSERLKNKTATGSRINEATTFVNTAAMPKFQPER